MSENHYVDENGTHYGWCNSCGEEAELFAGECCEDGEIEPYDDDPDPEGVADRG